MQQKLMKKTGNLNDDVKSMKCTSEEKTTSHQSVLSADVLEAGKRTNAKSSEKNLTVIESNLFGSNSIFDSINLNDIATPQSTKLDKNKKSPDSVDPYNDDIINRVLQIERLQNNFKAVSQCQLNVNSVPTNDKTNQKNKNNKELNLLQDNYDEIIANVELPQSEDLLTPISYGEEQNHKLNRTLTQCKNSPTKNKPCNVAQKLISESSSNDMFEHYNHPAKNVRESYLMSVSRNVDKENIVSCSQKERGSVENRKDKINVTVGNLDSVVDEDSRRKITSKNNMSHEKDKFLENVDMNKKSLDKEISTKSASQPHIDDEIQRKAVANKELNLKDNSVENDSLSCLDITIQQANLQMFEKDLFNTTAIQNKKNTVNISKGDSSQEEQLHTPPKRKQSADMKNAASEVSEFHIYKYNILVNL